MESIRVLDEELAKKFSVHVRYILIECDICGRSFGANPSQNTIRPDQLICQDCSVKKILEK